MRRRGEGGPGGGEGGGGGGGAESDRTHAGVKRNLSEVQSQVSSQKHHLWKVHGLCCELLRVMIALEDTGYAYFGP